MDLRLNTLKQNLYDLGYNDPLPEDAVPLVDKILSDLIHTTNRLKYYKDIADNLTKEKQIFRLGSEPYKCSNSRLLEENNTLRLQLLKANEGHHQIENDLRSKIKKLSHENSMLQSDKLKLECKLYKRAATGKKDNMKPSNLRRTTEPVNCRKKGTDCKCDKLYKDAESRIQSLNCELVSREREIERLMQLLSLNGRSTEALVDECCFKDIDAKLEVYKKQISNLEHENSILQAQLNETVAKQHEAMKKAVSLADRNRQLEKELLAVDHMALTVESDCNTAVKRNSEKLLTLQGLLNSSQARIVELESQLNHYKQTYDENSCSKRSFDNLFEEKNKMQEKINQFHIIERDLNNEIDRLTTLMSQQRHRLEELESHLLDIDKKDRQKLKSPQPICHRSYDTEQGAGEEGPKPSIHRCPASKYYKKQELTQTHQDFTNNNLTELKRQVNEKELWIKQLQEENRDLARKNHTLEMEAHHLKEENRWMGGVSNNMETTRTTLKKLQLSIDLARSDIHRLEDERDDLRNRLKVATEFQKSEARRFECIAKNYEATIKKLENDRHDCIMETGCRGATIAKLTNQCTEYKDKLEAAEQELCHLRTLYAQVKTLQDQTDMALSESQSKQIQLEKELQEVKCRGKKIEIGSECSQKQLIDCRNELCALKSKLSHLDCEKDNLLMRLDDKTEEVEYLKNELSGKNECLKACECEKSTMQQELCKTVDQLHSKETALRNAQSELNQLKRESDVLRKSRDCCAAENRKLQSELADAQCNVEIATNKLDCAQKEINDLKLQLQNYVTDVSHIEDILAEKERERNEMLDNFRQLSHEASSLENTNNCLATEATHAKSEVACLNQKLNELKIRLEDSERSYQCQVNKLTAQVAHLECELKNCADEKCCTEEYCQKLTEEKMRCCQQKSETEQSRNQLDAELQSLRNQFCDLENEISCKSAIICKLEEQIKSTRKDYKCSEMQSNELREEIAELQSTIDRLQRKISKCTCMSQIPRSSYNPPCRPPSPSCFNQSKSDFASTKCFTCCKPNCNPKSRNINKSSSCFMCNDPHGPKYKLPPRCVSCKDGVSRSQSPGLSRVMFTGDLSSSTLRECGPLD